MCHRIGGSGSRQVEGRARVFANRPHTDRLSQLIPGDGIEAGKTRDQRRDRIWPETRSLLNVEAMPVLGSAEVCRRHDRSGVRDTPCGDYD